jgi:hypothetical protein
MRAARALFGSLSSPWILIAETLQSGIHLHTGVAPSVVTFMHNGR